jgi:hypothetical protein
MTIKGDSNYLEEILTRSLTYCTIMTIIRFVECSTYISALREFYFIIGLDNLTERNSMQVGENCIIRTFKLCTLSPNSIRVTRSRRLRWAGHVAHIRLVRSARIKIKWKAWRKETTWKTQA